MRQTDGMTNAHKLADWYLETAASDPTLAHFACAWILLMEARILRGTKPCPHLYSSTMIFAEQLLGATVTGERLDRAAQAICDHWRYGELFGAWFTESR
jgi:hypothetical protein